MKEISIEKATNGFVFKSDNLTLTCANDIDEVCDLVKKHFAKEEIPEPR